MAVSLRTRSFREAEHLAALLDDGFGPAFVEAERTAMTRRSMDAIPAPDLNAILRGYLNAMLDADRMNRISRVPGQPIYGEKGRGDQGAIRAARSRALMDLANHTPSEGVQLVADLLARKHQLPDDQRAALLVGLMEANLRATEIVERRTSGAQAVVFVEPDAPQCPPEPAALVTPAAETLPPVKLFSALAEKEGEREAPFLHHRATFADATHQVMGQERSTLRRFREVCGNRPVNAYNRSDIILFLATLRQLPATYGKSPKDKSRSLTEIILEADASGSKRLTDKTVKRHLSTLSQFFNWAVGEGHLTIAAWTELVEKHSFRTQRGAREQRDAWLPEDLIKLFASPVWTGCHPWFRTEAGPVIIRDAKFWLPLLALYHGARLEEFADLYRRDVECDEGTWFIRIRESQERRSDQRQDDGRMVEGRRLKNDNATRTIPLHPELVRLGFVQYIEKTPQGIMRQHGDPLFPELVPQGKDRKRGPRITRWFGEYRRAVGVYRQGVAVHAFRHTANTRLRDAMTTVQHKRHINYLLGHSQGGGEGEGRYDKGPGLRDVAQTLALLRYAEIDLSHLYLP